MFETTFCIVAQAGPEHTNLLSWLPKCWDNRHVLSCLANHTSLILFLFPCFICVWCVHVQAGMWELKADGRNHPQWLSHLILSVKARAQQCGCVAGLVSQLMLGSHLQLAGNHRQAPCAWAGRLHAHGRVCVALGTRTLFFISGQAFPHRATSASRGLSANVDEWICYTHTHTHMFIHTRELTNMCSHTTMHVYTHMHTPPKLG